MQACTMKSLTQDAASAPDGAQRAPQRVASSAVTAADSADSLNPAELQHYQRQLLLPEVGLEGQRALKRGRVLVVGAGGLGSPVLLYLAAAGVGTLGIVEHDRVELSNLHRQVLFDVHAVGLPKAEAARRRLVALNPNIKVVVHAEKLVPDNAATLVRDYDVVVDATDNFTARYLINEACVRAGKPNVSASILRFEGQLSVFVPGQGPCYRCLFPEPPPPHLAPSCAEAGVLGALPGTIGALQATEAIKLLLGMKSPLIGRLLTFDAIHMQFQTLEVARDTGCPVCAHVHDADGGALARAPARASAPVIEIDVVALRARLIDTSTSQRPFLLDVRHEDEFRESHITGATQIALDRLVALLDDLPRGVPIVCVCQRGARSRMAAQMLIELGFLDVLSLEGGMDAWHSVQCRERQCATA